MNAEFNWWLLIVGVVVGAGLVWLVIADWGRREEDLSIDERQAESAWIAQTLRERGEAIDPAAAEEVLALHRAYLRQSAGLAADEAGPAMLDDDEGWPPEPEADMEPGSEEKRDEGPGAGAGPGDAGDFDWLRPARGRLDTGDVDGSPTADPGRPGRGSVRSSRLSPRGGVTGMESEPRRPA